MLPLFSSFFPFFHWGRPPPHCHYDTLSHPPFLQHCPVQRMAGAASLGQTLGIALASHLSVIKKNNVHKQFTHGFFFYVFSLTFLFFKTAGHKPNSFIQYAASAKRCKHPIYFPCVLHKQNLASCLVARSLPALAHRPFLN